MHKKFLPLFSAVLFNTPVLANSSSTEDEPVKVNSSVSMQAFTGVFNTPNTQVIDYGHFNFNYSDNYFDDSSRYINSGGLVRAHDLKFGVGLLPNVEVIGRLGTRSWDDNCYEADGCGFRDLSASIKWQLPYIPQNWFDVAVGVQDLGGASNYSETFYGVVSKELLLDRWGALRVNAGLSSADNKLNHLDGAIGSIEYQYNDYFQVAGEYDANGVNVGLKAFLPKAWLPLGWKVNVSAQLYSSKSDNNEHDQWFSAGISIPLSQQASAAKNNSLSLPGETIKISESLAASDTNKEKVTRVKLVNVNSSNIDVLAEKLQQHGFESIYIGVRAGTLIARFENNIYNRNEFDSLTAARGIIEQSVGELQMDIELTNFGLVTKKAHYAGSKALLIHDSIDKRKTPWYNLAYWLKPKQHWLVNNEQSAHFTPRLILAPSLPSAVGTEFGSFDYQLTLSSNLQMSVWDGGLIDIRHMSDTIASSDDFDDGEYFYRKFGNRTGIDRRLFHQTVSLPFNVFTKFSYGRIYGNSDGLLNETRWQSNSNNHRITTLWGDFKDKRRGWRGDRTYYKPKLVKYRYRYEKLNWDMEVTAGEYWNGDKGFTLRSLHWFGNTQVGLKYKRTKFDDHNGVDGEEEDFVALGFAIPLNFEKSMRPNYGFQVRGIEQWNYSVETLLTTEGNANSLKTGFGKEPLLYHNLDQAYFNRDR